MIHVPADPYPYPLDPGHTALVVIDMQRDFVEPGGFGAALGNDVSLLQAIVPTVAALIALFRDRGWPVIHTRECHAPDLADCPPAKLRRGRGEVRIGDPGPMGRILVRGEPGAEIVAACAPVDGELVLDKPGKGMFHATGIEANLRERGITHLVFAGVTTEVCVQTSMREANDRGFECLLVSDATESYFPEFKAATLRMIAAQGGIVGWVAPLDALAAAMSAASPAPAFDPEAVIDALAPLLGLDIPPGRRPGVAANLRLAAAMAALVLADPVGDHAEPAPVFRPEAGHREDRRD